MVFEIPTVCPICGGKTKILDNNGIKVLYCTNQNCDGKLVNKISHYCSKNAMNIDGISNKIIELLLDNNFINSKLDLYELKNYKDQLYNINGLGKKSVDKLLENIESSKNCNLSNFINSIQIPNIGKKYSDILANTFKTYDNFKNYVSMSISGKYTFSNIEGFGTELNDSIKNFDYTEADKLSKIMHFITIEKIKSSNKLNNLVFVITGKLNNFSNRDELILTIHENGGIVANSVTKNTNFLINNDISSKSSKNKKANELGIKIINENEFINMI